MQVQVNLLGQLHLYPHAQPKTRTIDCPDGANLSQIVDMLEIPRNDLYHAVIGSVPQVLSYQPKEGDSITFIPVSVSG